MARVLSGVQPSGEVHLGNYLGAFRSWVAHQHDNDAFYCVVDLHALSQDYDPTLLAGRTLATATGLLAAGLDPEGLRPLRPEPRARAPRLAWLLECTATFGELGRMTQFKDKAGESESVRVGLFTYPVLMAADILLYDADHVPVGDDQRQHLELTRDLAIRFNHHFGDTFVVPRAAVPTVGARVMDLQEPTRKMSKSRLLAPRDHSRPRLSGRHRPQGAQGRHRHRDRGPLRPGDQARRLEPARAPGRRHRRHPVRGRHPVRRATAP